MLLYIAGPYRGKSEDEVARNMAQATLLGANLCKSGHFAVCPHAMTNAYLLATELEVDDQFWIDMTLAMMECCDAVVLAPGWSESAGTHGEMARAVEMGKPIWVHSSYRFKVVDLARFPSFVDVMDKIRGYSDLSELSAF